MNTSFFVLIYSIFYFGSSLDLPEELPGLKIGRTVGIFSCLDGGTVEFAKIAKCGVTDTTGECSICDDGVKGENDGGVTMGYVLESQSDFHLLRLHRKDILVNGKKTVRNKKGEEEEVVDYTDFNGAWWSFGDLTCHLKTDGYVVTDTMADSAVCAEWGDLIYVSFVRLTRGTKICVGATQSMQCPGKLLKDTDEMQVYMARRIKNDGTTDDWAQFVYKANRLKILTCATDTVSVSCASCATNCWDKVRRVIGAIQALGGFVLLEDDINALIN
eukprot:c27291_g1_i1.p1 GENE.c27291_g1_i1~~c27291_g1_i1.p1  ORF type:complete len:273 (+),score=36.99 c27291_g1_i1:51-869(+)